MDFTKWWIGEGTYKVLITAEDGTILYECEFEMSEPHGIGEKISDGFHEIRIANRDNPKNLTGHSLRFGHVSSSVFAL